MNIPSIYNLFESLTPDPGAGSCTVNVDNAAKIIGSVLTTIGKKVANKFAQITGAKELPYPEVASGSDKAQTFESEEAEEIEEAF